MYKSTKHGPWFFKYAREHELEYLDQIPVVVDPPMIKPGELSVEFEAFQAAIRLKTGKTTQEFYGNVHMNSAQSDAFPNLAILARIAHSFPTGSVENARDFSTMNLNKTALRNKLGSQNLNSVCRFSSQGTRFPVSLTRRHWRNGMRSIAGALAEHLTVWLLINDWQMQHCTAGHCSTSWLQTIVVQRWIIWHTVYAAIMLVALLLVFYRVECFDIRSALLCWLYGRLGSKWLRPQVSCPGWVKLVLHSAAGFWPSSYADLS